ncbi:MAG: hypothetical protein ACRCVJ_16730 [Clostridium sp.]|uniref:hypothetical protein n=1 Tax=Clostridium sp. TaxID=1506 RepID=UPI003F318403
MVNNNGCNVEVINKGSGINIKKIILNPIDNNIDFKNKTFILTMLVIGLLTTLSSIMNFQYNIRELFIDTFMWELIFNIFKISIATVILYILFDDEVRDKEGVRGALQYVLIASLSRIGILSIGALLSVVSVSSISIISTLGLVAFVLNLYVILTIRGNFTNNKGIAISFIMILFM